MTPDFRITSDSGDLTAKIKAHFLSLTIEDNAGIDSDTLTIELDDVDWNINIPKRGVKLDAYLGYKGQALVLMGKYVVDSTDYTLAPNKLTIKAKAADVYLASKEKGLKKRSFDNTTLGAVVERIAGDMGLKAAVSPEMAGIEVKHIDQTDESNLHFLTRLAKKYDATAKPAGGKLVFVKTGAGTTASGNPLPSITVALSDIQPGARWAAAGRGEYDGAEASWHDKGAAKKQAVTSGGENRKKLRGTFATEADAKAAVDAENTRLQREPTTLELTLKQGNALVRAEMHVLTDDSFRKPELIGKWLVKRCTHKLAKKPGYSTSVSLERLA
jgi:phage protein D